jgi:ParB/Sulfiredoxin domain
MTSNKSEETQRRRRRNNMKLSDHWNRPYLPEGGQERVLAVAKLRINAYPRKARDVYYDELGLIQRWARKMRAGRKFPLIEVVPMSKGRYRVVDGNHRFLAWRLTGAKKIPVLLYKG